MTPAPSPYVKEMNDAGQFYTNRVLKVLVKVKVLKVHVKVLVKVLKVLSSQLKKVLREAIGTWHKPTDGRADGPSNMKR